MKRHKYPTRQIALGFTMIGMMIPWVFSKNVRAIEPPIDPTAIRVEISPEPTLEEITIEQEIKRVFGEDWKLARAVFKAESGLKAKAMNWNCEYINEKGEKYSMSCWPEDRGKAWSVDCGIAQLNFKGRTCPEKSFDVSWNIREAYYQKFKMSGWNPWYAYKNGSYKSHLK